MVKEVVEVNINTQSPSNILKNACKTGNKSFYRQVRNVLRKGAILFLANPLRTLQLNLREPSVLGEIIYISVIFADFRAMLLKHEPKKILIIKLRKLGDVLSTTPTIRQLHKLFPNAHITFLTESLGANVYEHSNYIKNLWILNRKPSFLEFVTLCYNVHNKKFDLVIDLYDHNKTALITLCSRAKYRFGYSKNGNSTLAYNNVVQLTENDKTNMYCVSHQLKLIDKLGISYDDNRIEFEIPDRIKEFGKKFVEEYKLINRTIAFCVQSERGFAQVSVDFLTDIGNYLVKEGYFLYFVYGPGEKKQALRVYNKIQNKKSCLVDYKMPTVAQVKAILENCLLYIGNDGGNKHLAVAANIPTIALFYGDNPKVWTPPKQNTHRYLQTKNNKTAFDDFVAMFERWDYGKKQFVND